MKHQLSHHKLKHLNQLQKQKQLIQHLILEVVLVLKMTSNLRQLHRKEKLIKRRRSKTPAMMIVSMMMKMIRKKKRRLSRLRNQNQFQNHPRKSKLLLKQRRLKQPNLSKLSKFKKLHNLLEVRKEKARLQAKMRQICRSSGRKLPRSNSNS